MLAEVEESTKIRTEAIYDVRLTEDVIQELGLAGDGLKRMLIRNN